ncbi:MAG TPA: hypothetical protein VK215_09245 [Acidimicrobiales bacterium]|nr:hypothetical protein [Acidimicrobiales bacterium]
MDRDEPVPEADALEQEEPVVPERGIRLPPDRGDVPEADWLEQSVAEPLDDEDR